MKTMSESNLLQRYSASERFNHWIVALAFIMLAASGLALFHPAFFFLTGLFGGGPWTRILHPFIGVVMFVFFLGMMFRFWRHNRITAADRQWMAHLGDVLKKRAERLPEVGRYNAGQKYLFKLMVLTVLLLLVTGVIIWRPYFAPAFSVPVLRWAVLLHAVAAWLLMAGILIHIYAALWVKGTIRAMTRGTVTRAWARHHHPGWYKEVTRETN